MNYELFIARHLRRKDPANISGPFIRIAIIAIALGLVVMILAVSIVTGFQKEIREKISGFAAHVQITSYDFNRSFEAAPVRAGQDFYPSMEELEGIKHIQVFANKAGIIKTEDQIEGIVLKGVGSDYDWSFISDNLLAGRIFPVADSGKTDAVVVSKTLADKLELNLGDDLRVYFIDKERKAPRGRKFQITGIYETGFEEVDQYFVLADIAHVRKLNNWDADQVAGFEVFLDAFESVESMRDQINDMIGYDLKATSIKERYPQIFDWLELQDINVVVIIVLMILVAGITMVSALLVIILERANMIGILKALGIRTWSVRKIFLYQSVYIILRGLFWGNVFGIGLALLQKYGRILPLPQESYYIQAVPVNLTFEAILLLNAMALIICTVMLIVPSYIVSKITPIKAIRWD